MLVMRLQRSTLLLVFGYHVSLIAWMINIAIVESLIPISRSNAASCCRVKSCTAQPLALWPARQSTTALSVSSTPISPLSPSDRLAQSRTAGRDPLLSLNLNLDALARARAPERAQELYQRIAALHERGYYGAQPDTVSFNTVLKAWSECGDPARALEFWEEHAASGSSSGDGASDGAANLNRETDDRYGYGDQTEDGTPPRSRVNVTSYNTFLLALARAGLYESAVSLLHQMRAVNAAARPDRISYNTVLLAYATAAAHTSEDSDGIMSNNDKQKGGVISAVAQGADELLREMLSESKNQLNSISSSRSTQTAAKVGASATIDGTRDPRKEKTDDMLGLPPVVDPYYVVPTPDATSFNTVLLAWTYHKDPKVAARQCELWMRDMASHGVEPDVYTYTTVLQAWRRLSGPVAVERALSLLREMEGHCNGSTKPDATSKQPSLVVPNRVTYTLVVQILCHNGRAPQAHEIVSNLLASEQQSSSDTTPPVRPDVVMVSALMDGWAEYARARAAVDDTLSCQIAVESVMSLLKMMKDSRDSALAPNAITYTSVLKTIAAAQLSDSGRMVEQILHDLSAPDSPVEPSTIHYNTALDACAQRPKATKGVEAERVWIDMRQRGIQCDTITYNIILKSAAASYGSVDLKRTSLKIGQEAFAALQADRNCDATSLTYNYYFKLLRRLAPNRLDFLEQAFVSCCQGGCLNEILLQKVQQRTEDRADVQKTLWGEHLSSSNTDDKKNGAVSLSDLPTEWSQCAMKDVRRWRKRSRYGHRTSGAQSKGASKRILV